MTMEIMSMRKKTWMMVVTFILFSVLLHTNTAWLKVGCMYTVNVLPVFITVLISVNLQPRKVLVIFTAFHSTLTLSVKLGVQAKPVYITGKLTLLAN